MIIEKIERLEDDYSKASEVAWDYLNLLRSSSSPGISQRTQLAVSQTSVSCKKVIDAYPESSKADFCTKNI